MSLTGPGQKAFLQAKHSCFPPLFPPPSYQSQECAEKMQMKMMNLSGLPAWSDTLPKPKKSEKRDVFTCFNVIYRTQSIGSGLQRRCTKGERKISPKINLLKDIHTSQMRLFTTPKCIWPFLSLYGLSQCNSSKTNKL